MIDGMCFDNKNELINELNRKIQIKTISIILIQK